MRWSTEQGISAGEYPLYEYQGKLYLLAGDMLVIDSSNDVVLDILESGYSTAYYKESLSYSAYIDKINYLDGPILIDGKLYVTKNNCQNSNASSDIRRQSYSCFISYYLFSDKGKFVEDKTREKKEERVYPFTYFSKGTKILMSDGKRENIEDIKSGDLIKSINGREGIWKSKDIEVVENVKRSGSLVTINNILKTGPDQSLYYYVTYYTDERGEGVKAKELKTRIGKELLGENKEKIKIISVDYSDEKVDVYDLIFKDNNSDGEYVFADGLLVFTPNTCYSFPRCSERQDF